MLGLWLCVAGVRSRPSLAMLLVGLVRKQTSLPCKEHALLSLGLSALNLGASLLAVRAPITDGVVASLLILGIAFVVDNTVATLLILVVILLAGRVALMLSFRLATFVLGPCLLASSVFLLQLAPFIRKQLNVPLVGEFQFGLSRPQ